MLFPDACCLSDKSLCSSKCAIIFEQTICSSNLHGTQVRRFVVVLNLQNSFPAGSSPRENWLHLFSFFSTALSFSF